jgi:glycine/serine hydroxymethyltransferase
MGLEEMTRVAELIDEVLTRKDDATVERVRADVEELAAGFPLYDRASVRKLAHA